MNARRATGSIALTAAACALLAGCVGAPDGGATSAPPMPHPTFTPTFSPTADASKNQAYFEYVVSGVIAKTGITTETKTMANALVAAGFAKSGIEFGDSATAIGMKPDSVMVAAKQGNNCLIVQYGHSLDSPAFSVQPVLSTGGCLLGRTINRL